MIEIPGIILLIGLTLSIAIQVRVNAVQRRQINILQDTVLDVSRRLNKTSIVVVMTDKRLNHLKARFDALEADSQPTENTVESKDEHQP